MNSENNSMKNAIKVGFGVIMEDNTGASPREVTFRLEIYEYYEVLQPSIQRALQVLV